MNVKSQTDLERVIFLEIKRCDGLCLDNAEDRRLLAKAIDQQIKREFSVRRTRPARKAKAGR